MMAAFFIEIHEGRRKNYKKNGIISTIKCILWYSIKYSENMYDIINTKKEFNLYEEINDETFVTGKIVGIN